MSNKKNHIGEANKMISSVEWLFQKLWDTPKDKLNWYAILKEAKEMHKEEVDDAYGEGYADGIHKNDVMYQDSIDYYNKTFNK
jgi:hypothetical protein